MDKLDNLIGVIADQLLKLAQTHGEQAVQLGMLVFQIPYMQGLLTGLGFLIFILIGLPTGIWGIKNAVVFAREEDDMRQYPYGIGGVVLCFISLLVIPGVFTNLFVIANWLGAFSGPAAVAMTLAKTLTK